MSMPKNVLEESQTPESCGAVDGVGSWHENAQLVLEAHVPEPGSHISVDVKHHALMLHSTMVFEKT